MAQYLNAKSIVRLLVRVALLGSFCGCFSFLVVPQVYSEVKTEKFKIATMGSQCYWKLFADQRVFYGGLFPRDTIIAVTYSPEMFLDNSTPGFVAKGTLEFDVSELMVMSEQDPNEAMTWKNNFLSDEYLAVSKYPRLSFEIQSVSLYRPSETETTNAKVKGSIVAMGRKTPVEFSARLGIGGGYLMANADFEIPKNVFVNEENKTTHLGQNLVGKKILMKVKIVAQRSSEPAKQ